MSTDTYMCMYELHELFVGRGVVGWRANELISMICPGRSRRVESSHSRRTDPDWTGRSMGVRRRTDRAYWRAALKAFCSQQIESVCE